MNSGYEVCIQTRFVASGAYIFFTHTTCCKNENLAQIAPAGISWEDCTQQVGIMVKKLSIKQHSNGKKLQSPCNNCLLIRTVC